MVTLHTLTAHTKGISKAIDKPLVLFIDGKECRDLQLVGIGTPTSNNDLHIHLTTMPNEEVSDATTFVKKDEKPYRTGIISTETGEFQEIDTSHANLREEPKQLDLKEMAKLAGIQSEDPTQKLDILVNEGEVRVYESGSVDANGIDTGKYIAGIDPISEESTPKERMEGFPDSLTKPEDYDTKN